MAVNPSQFIARKGIISLGGVTFPQLTINGTYNLTDDDYLIDVTGGTFNIQLQSAVGRKGRLIVIKNNGGGSVTILPYPGETIEDKITR